jgi:hypothetical protein
MKDPIVKLRRRYSSPVGNRSTKISRGCDVFHAWHSKLDTSMRGMTIPRARSSSYGFRIVRNK